MNIQSINKLDSPNTFLVIVVTVSKKIDLRKTCLKFSAWFIMKKKDLPLVCNTRVVHKILLGIHFPKFIDWKNATTKKFDFLERTRWKSPLRRHTQSGRQKKTFEEHLGIFSFKTKIIIIIVEYILIEIKIFWELFKWKSRFLFQKIDHFLF